MNAPRAGDERRRVGVMGGTFDPIHHGHLVAASEVQSWFDLDEVIFVPTGQPWQKADRDVSPAEDRYLMTVIATAANPRERRAFLADQRNGSTGSASASLNAWDSWNEPMRTHWPSPAAPAGPTARSSAWRS